MARHDQNRDGKKGTLQVVIGRLCTREGCPMGVEGETLLGHCSSSGARRPEASLDPIELRGDGGGEPVAEPGLRTGVDPRVSAPLVPAPGLMSRCPHRG
ncbi:MAG: hypothetical protein JXQ29_11260 [Planctomycetes bacterium]|nr:hypothetical protein [Planctomycetota bacterium]